MIIKITKCTGEGCPLKEKCYRFVSELQEKDEVFEKPPFIETNSDETNAECDSFLLNEIN